MKIYEGMKLLVKFIKNKAAQADYAAYYNDMNAKNKMAWVPTTDNQTRTYYYNLYTRETRWDPLHGAPRIELAWWEQPYAVTSEQRRKKAEAEANEEFDM